MLAAETAPEVCHDDLPKRDSGSCEDCERRYKTADKTMHGHWVFRCEVHECIVKCRDAACRDDYVQSQAAAARDRASRILWHDRQANHSSSTAHHIEKSCELRDVEAARCRRAPAPQGDVCPRCGGELRRDGESVVCVGCWNTIVDADRVSYRRPYADALAYFQTSRRWEY